METNYELMNMVQEQEMRLIFDEFNSETAFEIGVALMEEAKSRNNKIAIDIFAFGKCLFHYASNECEASNDNMIERKINTTLYTGHSSLWAFYFLADIGMTIDEKWSLSPSEYAAVGGAIPIRLKNCGGIIGTITVSGFAHTMDHGIIIDVLEKYLNL